MFRKILLILFLTIHTAWADSTSGWQTYADIARYVIPASAAAVTIYERDLKGFEELALSVGITQAATEGLKVITREERPNGSCCASFPSGHVSASFSGASFLQRRYGWKYSVLPYLASIMVGVARVETNAHHPHDVVAGAILAMGINLLITKPYTFRNKTKLTLLPEASPIQSSLTLTYWF